MNTGQSPTSTLLPIERFERSRSAGKSSFDPVRYSNARSAQNGRRPPNAIDAQISSLKVLALSLLKRIEWLETRPADEEVEDLNLQTEVHRFEAELIRNALIKTGGRQRRAAKLLGTKVTTLNTKIRRYQIKLDDPLAEDAPES